MQDRLIVEVFGPTNIQEEPQRNPMGNGHTEDAYWNAVVERWKQRKSINLNLFSVGNEYFCRGSALPRGVTKI